MTGWSLIFVALTAVAGVLAYGGAVGSLAALASVMFFLFLTLLVVSVVSRLIEWKSHR